MRTIEELKRIAERVSAEMLDAASRLPSGEGSQQGSAHRALPESTRNGFLALRGELFARGIYDPVLVRFDSATAPQATTQQIGEQLAALAASLTV